MAHIQSVLESISTALRQAANRARVAVLDAPMLANDRLERRHCLCEQAIAQLTHRYGNLLTAPGR